jgi:hypothetical protein
MKNGKLALSGLLGITLAAFALPCWGIADMSTAPQPLRTLSGAQYAGGAGEHSEHEEHEYTAPAPSHEEHEEHERMEHGNGGEEEHGGARNFMEQHVPGTEAHQQHEEREGEEHHNYHHHDND